MASGAEASEIAALAREYSELKPVVEEIHHYQQLVSAEADAKAMLEDPEMRDLAEEELAGLKDALPAAEQALKIALLPRDSADARPAIIEIRPGTGHRVFPAGSVHG